tara:strand:- start:30 stop:302 length:273 start_codon:yes stop_codon:yes gene_type:complete
MKLSKYHESLLKSISSTPKRKVIRNNLKLHLSTMYHYEQQIQKMTELLQIKGSADYFQRRIEDWNSQIENHKKKVGEIEDSLKCKVKFWE